jgi:hypothetical protein
MKRRGWKLEQKALIVLEGLKGRPIGELCAEHEISQVAGNQHVIACVAVCLLYDYCTGWCRSSLKRGRPRSRRRTSSGWRRTPVL